MVTWQTGDPLSGTPVPAGDVEFTLEQQGGEEMVVVAEPKAKAVKGEARGGWRGDARVGGVWTGSGDALQLAPVPAPAPTTATPPRPTHLSPHPPPAGDFLVRHIARFEEIMRDLEALKPVPQAPAPGAPGAPGAVAAH